MTRDKLMKRHILVAIVLGVLVSLILIALSLITIESSCCFEW